MATPPVEHVEKRAKLSTAAEAWILMHRIHWAEKPRFMAIGQEFDLAPQQGMALRALHEPRPMGELAKFLACDNSNVTGIVDRLEAAGLAERRPAPHDRRVKAVALTSKGESVRTLLQQRAGEPPPPIAGLSDEDAAALHAILRRALDG
jgi:DNA-binding MarR family transcriptional regulator